MSDSIEELFSHYAANCAPAAAPSLVIAHVIREATTRRPKGRPAKKPSDEQSLTTDIETFVAKNCHEAAGHLIEFAEFRERFNDSRPDNAPVSAKRLAMSLPARIVYGAYTNNTRHVANLSWEPVAPTGKPAFTSRNAQLIKGR